jgi:hypothetical protein
LSYDIENIYHGSPYIINNGIPRIEYGTKIEQEQIIITFLSNLIISKGVFDFLDSISLLKKKQDLNGLLMQPLKI